MTRPDLWRRKPAWPNGWIGGALLILSLAACQKKQVSREPATPARTIDWCMGHGVPESVCTRCNPELIPSFKAKGDWCAEHGLPESQCLVCNPDIKVEPPPEVKEMLEKGGTSGELQPGDQEEPENAGGSEAAGAPGDAVPGDFCLEHKVPEAECALCLPDLARTLSTFSMSPAERELRPASHYPKIRLADTGVAARAGIRAIRAGALSEGGSIDAPAEIVVDENRSAPLATPVAGVVRRLAAAVGDRVERGQVLAVLSSPDVALARAELVRAGEEAAAARRELEREASLREQKITSEKDYLAARARERQAAAALDAAEARLAAFGHGGAVEREARDPAEYLLRSPLDGEVVARPARLGDALAAGAPVIEIADRNHLWVDIMVPLAQASSVKPSQVVEFQTEALWGSSFLGQVLSVSPEISQASRTVTVRASVENTDLMLRPHMFGRAYIMAGGPEGGTWVPEASIVRYSGRPVAFVRLASDLYEVRPVTTGARRDEGIEVTAGLEPGEDVVTDGAFLLKTEISRGSIGAGCCDVVALKK